MPHPFHGPHQAISLNFPDLTCLASTGGGGLFRVAGVDREVFGGGAFTELSWLRFATTAWLAQAEDGDFLTRMLSNPLILPVGLLLIFYLTFIAPERRRRAEEAKMMASLKKNDRVVTVGGIHGTVVATASDSDVVTLRVDESSNTRLKVNRSAIAKITTPPKDKEKESKTNQRTGTTATKASGGDSPSLSP